MKRFNFKAIFAVALILSLTVIFVGCSFDNEYSKWKITPDMSEITENGRYNQNFALAETLVGYELAGRFVEFYDEPYTRDYGYFSIYSSDLNSDVFFLMGGDSPLFIYSNNGLPDYIYEFTHNGIISGAKIHDAMDVDFNRDITLEELAQLDALTASEEFNVTELNGKVLAELKVYGAKGMLARDRGAFYSINGETYYLNFDALDNSYFDADGNFSYRKGTVKLARLGEEELKLLDNDKFEYAYMFYTDLEPEMFAQEDKESTVLEVRISFGAVLLLFVGGPAIVPFTFMLIDLIKKRGKGVHFTTYVILGATAFIIISAVILFIMTF